MSTEFEGIKHSILSVAMRGRPFTADAVRQALPSEPSNPNLIGLAFQHLAKEHRILPIGNSVSQTESRAGGSLRVWVSANPHQLQTLSAWC